MTDKVAIKHFSSIGDFGRHIAKLPREFTKRHEPSSFNGHTTVKDVLKGVIEGNMAEVPKAEALLDKLLDTPVEFDVPRLNESVAGFMPNVPAFIAGLPEAMFNFEQTPSDRAPVRIFASVCVSAGLTHDELRQRGASIMALAIKLSQIRPIELNLFADMGNYGGSSAFLPIIRLESSPLDLCAASYCFTHPGFLRVGCFDFAEEQSQKLFGKAWDGAWAWNADPNSAVSLRKTREAIGATDDDLVIPGGYSNDPMIKQPVEWLNDKLSKYLTTVEA